MNESTALARELFASLVRAGLSEVVLAPGSRNAPLAFAACDLAQAGLIRLHTRLDERTAGFLGLGLAKVSRRPVAVVCTSGTAVANLHPAVLEARHAGVRLVLLTADRPLRLRGTSANQTTDQVGIFPGVPGLDLGPGEQLPDLPDNGPVHLNVRFDEPLLPEDRWEGDRLPRLPAEPARSRPGPATATVPLGPRTVVVAGDDSGPPARVLAERAGWPLLAEPSSGCRTGTHALRCYRLLLDSQLGSRIERVLVFGHPTLSRPVTRLLNRPDVTVWDVGPPQWRPRPFAVEVTAAGVDVSGPDDPGWLEEWRAADRDLGGRLDALLAEEEELTPHQVAGAVSRALPPGGLLYLGASSPIRDLDLMVAPYEVGDRRKVLANRGLAGIDGTVSSAIGAALGRPWSTRSLVLLGDLTFLHDLTALIQAPREVRPDLMIIIVNDDGGSIFAMLEQGAAAYQDRYDTLFGLPHGLDLGAVCASLGIRHRVVTAHADLTAALGTPTGGIEVVEARVRRDNRRELDLRIRALAPR